VGTVIRPPAEWDSILLQVTLGCTHNKCAFCGAYKDKRFAIKPWEIIERDFAFAQAYCQRQRRVFLCDGDALSLPQAHLIKILEAIRVNLPWVNRVGAYGNARGLKRKSIDELKALRELGLRFVYLGLESGDEDTLLAVNKKETAVSIVEQGLKIREAGLTLSVTVLLGLAGPERSREHAMATGRALSAMAPDYASALSLMLIPGTPLHKDWEEGRFTLLDPLQTLAELRTLVAHIDVERGQFFANHASNYLPLKARLPRDKEATLALLDAALAGKLDLKPEGLRRL
jgi:radical SAM superfamily enzyme YgiQ (UPF0313 family)